ncbi:DUF362 domain-containing protein [Candidatus Poribacteria bacterium]
MSQQPVVSIVRSNDSTEAAVRKAVDLIGGLSPLISEGDTVLIKPNFIREEPSFTGTTTNIEVVRAVVKLVREAKASPIVGEASGNQYDTEAIYENIGVRDGLGDVEVLDLDRDEVVYVKIQGAKALKEVGVAKTALDADFIISVPLLKTHMTTNITIGMKNMMGTLPQREKWKMHMSGLHQALVDLNRLVKPNLVIVDGTVGMEGLGPTIGRPVQMNLILAGTDVVAVDTVGSAVMGFALEEVEHLVRAGKDGLGINDLGRIEVRGEKIEDVTRPFKRPFKGSLGPKFLFVWGDIQYRLGTFLLNRFDYDFRPWLKSVSDIYVSRPRLNKELCNLCGECVKVCRTETLMMKSYPLVNYGKCSKCLRCVDCCPENAFSISRKPGFMIKLGL